MDAIIYCETDCQETEVMRDHLGSLGIGCRLRHIDNGDPSARRE